MANELNLDQGTIMKAIVMLAPVVLGALSRKRDQGGMGSSGIAATLAGVPAMTANVARFGYRGGRIRSNPIVLLLLIVGASPAALPIRLLISRIREYAADRDGARLSGRPLSLADALRKISRSPVPLSRGNTAVALFKGCTFSRRRNESLISSSHFRMRVKLTLPGLFRYTSSGLAKPRCT